jgi:hypothetical protein
MPMDSSVHRKEDNRDNERREKRSQEGLKEEIATVERYSGRCKQKDDCDALFHEIRRRALT